jgi:hypothetical protein
MRITAAQKSAISARGKDASCSRDFVIAQDASRGAMYAIWKSRLQNGNGCSEIALCVNY